MQHLGRPPNPRADPATDAHVFATFLEQCLVAGNHAGHLEAVRLSFCFCAQTEFSLECHDSRKSPLRDLPFLAKIASRLLISGFIFLVTAQGVNFVYLALVKRSLISTAGAALVAVAWIFTSGYAYVYINRVNLYTKMIENCASRVSTELLCGKVNGAQFRTRFMAIYRLVNDSSHSERFSSVISITSLLLVVLIMSVISFYTIERASTAVSCEQVGVEGKEGEGGRGGGEVLTTLKLVHVTSRILGLRGYVIEHHVSRALK